MFRAFSLAAAVAAFALTILGSWIRINGAGLSCPDWPLCHGALVPEMSAAVVLEWSHRMVAMLTGLLLVGAIATGWRARREIAGVTPILSVLGLVFVLQVGLGAATVALANSPWSVVLHWAVGMLVLGALSALALVAIVRPEPGSAARRNGLFGLLVAAAVAAFVAMNAGAYVSSSGAGLACVALPACAGSWTGTTGPEIAQMVHRLAAGALFLLATVATYWAALGTTMRVRIATLFGYALIVVQLMLGMANVAWLLPLVLREAHAANAAATFIAFVCAVAFGILDGTVRSAATPMTAQPVRAR